MKVSYSKHFLSRKLLKKLLLPEIGGNRRKLKVHPSRENNYPRMNGAFQSKNGKGTDSCRYYVEKAIHAKRQFFREKNQMLLY